MEEVSTGKTLPAFVADDYPVTDDMLRTGSGHTSSYKMQSGEVSAFDKAWFVHSPSDQVLVFELYTDLHRLVTYHFKSSHIPEELIDRMELHLSDGNLAPLSAKKGAMQGLISQANPIGRAYFTSSKGLRIGDSRDKVIALYGQPDTTTETQGLEVCKWAFPEYSFGHEATYFFREGKIIAVILYNAIP